MCIGWIAIFFFDLVCFAFVVLILWSCSLIFVVSLLTRSYCLRIVFLVFGLVLRCFGRDVSLYCFLDCLDPFGLCVSAGLLILVGYGNVVFHWVCL